MKEATGELNVTVVVVIIVALLAFFFFSFLWPRIHGGFRQSTNCDMAICVCEDKDEQGRCQIPVGGYLQCHVRGNENEVITCPWKG